MSSSQTSRRLCVGKLVAIPTAMPCAPLTSRFGNLLGRTVGSLRRSSYVGTKSTVSDSKSSSISDAIDDIRASVYRMAAGGKPAIEPRSEERRVGKEGG